MAIIYRRTFHAKPGKAGEVLLVLREIFSTLERYGFPTKRRLLTDYWSGRTDRVAAEAELGSIGELEADMERIMADPGAREVFSALQQRLFELIDHAEVEHWAVDAG